MEERPIVRETTLADYIKNPTAKVQQRVIESNPYVIQEMPYADASLKSEAVHAHYELYREIKTPSKELTAYHERISCIHATNRVECMQKNALEKDPQAAYILSSYYAKEKDGTEKRKTWLEKSADLGFLDAQSELASLYLSYHDRAYDKKAFELIKKLLKHNTAFSLYMYADMHMQGIGTKIDYKIAQEYYLLASYQNIAQADYALGTLYEEGKNGKIDFKLAKRYYTKAHEGGNIYASVKLGNLYFQDRYYERAYSWYKEGEKLGNPNAKEGLKKLANMGFIPPKALSQ